MYSRTIYIILLIQYAQIETIGIVSRPREYGKPFVILAPALYQQQDMRARIGQVWARLSLLSLDEAKKAQLIVERTHPGFIGKHLLSAREALGLECAVPRKTTL